LIAQQLSSPVPDKTIPLITLMTQIGKALAGSVFIRVNQR
jgi:hypothetical protein